MCEFWASLDGALIIFGIHIFIFVYLQTKKGPPHKSKRFKLQTMIGNIISNLCIYFN